MRGPERIRTHRDHVDAMVATDTFAALAERIEWMFSHGRRVCVATRLVERGSGMEVKAGLTLERIERRSPPDRCVFQVLLTSGFGLTTDGFGFSAPLGDEAEDEYEVWRRYDRGEQGGNGITRIVLKGGLVGDSPARDDQITVWRWTSEAVLRETVIVFDYGPVEEATTA